MDVASFQLQEIAFYCSLINEIFDKTTNASLAALLPLSPDNFVNQMRSGIIFGCLSNHFFGSKIDQSIIFANADEISQKVVESVVAVIKTQLSLPFIIDPQSISAGKKQAIVDLSWFLVRRHFLQKVQLNRHTFLLSHILETNSALEEVVNTHGEALLFEWCRWISGDTAVKSLSGDFKDGRIFIAIAFKLELNSSNIIDAFSSFAAVSCARHFNVMSISNGHPRLILCLLCDLFEYDGRRYGDYYSICLRLTDAQKQVLDLETSVKSLLLEKNSSLAVKQLECNHDEVIRKYEKRIMEIRNDFEIYKDDIKLEIADLIESAKQSERALMDGELRDMNKKDERLKQLLISYIASIRSAVSPDEEPQVFQHIMRSLADLTGESDSISIAAVVSDLLDSFISQHVSVHKELQFMKESAKNASMIDGIVETRVREFASRSGSINAL